VPAPTAGLAGLPAGMLPTFLPTALHLWCKLYRIVMRQSSRNQPQLLNCRISHTVLAAAWAPNQQCWELTVDTRTLPRPPCPLHQNVWQGIEEQLHHYRLWCMAEACESAPCAASATSGCQSCTSVTTLCGSSFWSISTRDEVGAAKCGAHTNRSLQHGRVFPIFHNTCESFLT
jgi:hypothetical protein